MAWLCICSGVGVGARAVRCRACDAASLKPLRASQTEVLFRELRSRGLPTWGRKDQVASSEQGRLEEWLWNA